MVVEPVINHQKVIVKKYTLKLIAEDKEHFNSMLLQHQQLLSETQQSILRMEGALALLNQIEKYMLDNKESSESNPTNKEK